MKRLKNYYFPFFFFLVSCANPVFPISSIIVNCMSVRSDMKATRKFSGTVILGNGEAFAFEDNILVHKQLLPSYNDKFEVIISDIYNSPDRQKLIYYRDYFTNNPLEYDSSHLFLLINGNYEKEVYGWNNLGRLIGWFDNEWLLFNPIVNPSKEINTTSPTIDIPGTIFLFNPTTMEKRKIISNIPDFYTLYPLPLWYKSINPLPIYNSTLNKAFYLSDNNGMVYSLWDVEHKQSLWNRKIGDPYSKPQWSPDNKKILVSLRKKLNNPNQIELFWIDINGKETQLTNISKNNIFVFIGNYEWSPNGEKIAFWINYGINTNNPLPNKIAVLDIKHGTIIDYCIESIGADIIWSPNGEQIVFMGSNNANPNDIIILDIEKQQATTIGKSKHFPVAWIN